MSEKILLIDGHSILNRAYYGLPNLTNWEGLHTNAVYGFLNIMTKVLEEEKPEYLAVTLARSISGSRRHATAGDLGLFSIRHWKRPLSFFLSIL